MGASNLGYLLKGIQKIYFMSLLLLPFIQVDNISSFIAHDLSFNVPGLEDQLLDENAAIAKRFLGFRPKQSNQKC